MKILYLMSLALFFASSLHAEPETLPPLQDGKVPCTFDELWHGFDPRAEPLEVEVLDEQEKDGIILKTLRFRIGVFNGKRAMMTGIYGYPKGAAGLPALIQIHGGGQYAHWKPVYTMAQRGYATLSIAWAGRYVTPDYTVGPDEVKLFWAGKTEDPSYHLMTDCGGGIDGYHAPCRYTGNNFDLNPPSESSIDPVKSPRNSGWFYVAMGVRRALTFLERQSEVDADRLGVFGHSMGGHLSVITAGSDERVKAAVPSCGGMSDRDKFYKMPEYVTTLGDDVYLKRITCPISFQSPANDFHGEISDLQLSLDEIQSSDWRITCAPHHNHMDTAENFVLTHLWFDQHLKKTFELAQTPEAKLVLKTENGIPRVFVRPDLPDEVVELNVYYTEQGESDNRANLEHLKYRYWKHAVATRKGDTWSADLPTFGEDSNLWVYANAKYSLPEPINGVGYGYSDYTADSYTLSSRMEMITPEQKQAAGVRATLDASLVIENFEGDWQKEWYSFKDEPTAWEFKTHKVYSPMFQPPLGAKLVFDVRSEQKNHLAINIGKTWKIVPLLGNSEWQTVEILPSDMNAHGPGKLTDWQDIKDFNLKKGVRRQELEVSC